MILTQKALLTRIATFRKDAMAHFASNPYVTIHDYSKSSSPEKKNPFTVWLDLNYPIYVLKGGKPVIQQGVKDICIKFKTTYPDERPVVILPVDIASVHTWNSKTACTHSVYNPETHNLIKEISNLMRLAANCPEGINYKSMTPDHSWLSEWTQKSLQNHTLPTIPYDKLFMIVKPGRRTGKLL